MKIETARRFVGHINEAMFQLNEAARAVNENEPNEMASSFRKAIGKIVWDIYVDLLANVHKEHPELKPTELE